MKGQFFIISTVIIVAAVILLTQYLFDYRKVDLTSLEETKELNYIQSIKDSLKSTVDNSDCTRLDSNLIETEKFMKNQLIQEGITLNIAHTVLSCPRTSFEFNISSSGFFSNTKFTYP